MKFYKFAVITYPIRSLVALLTRILISLRKKNIILVFGMSRSGTTMLSKFISLNLSSIYIHEPVKTFMKYRFEQNRSFYPGEFWKFVFSENQRKFKVHCLVCITLRAALTSHYKIRTICIKPISLTDVMKESSDSLKNARVIYISRHPCGRSESILRQHEYHQGFYTVSNKLLEELGRSCGKINSDVKALFHCHPEWQWVFFEKLTNNPLAEFRELYKRLGLSWNDKVQNEIQQMTTGEDGEFYETKRDSRKQAEKWRNVLTGEQIEFIRKCCLPYQTNLYESF